LQQGRARARVPAEPHRAGAGARGGLVHRPRLRPRACRRRLVRPGDMKGGLASRPRRAAALVALAAFGAAASARGAAQDDDAASADAQPAREAPHGKIKFFPIPMYTTVPTEGSTYGLMPVLLGVNGAGIVRVIGAPSVSWN